MDQKEIGGYIQLDGGKGSLFHEGALALNSGRNALAWLIEAAGIRKIHVPYFVCGTAYEPCEKAGVPVLFYHVDERFRPVPEDLPEKTEDGEWLYLVNHYGQLTEEAILQFCSRYPNVIVDNTQAYFAMPARGVQTIYSCRKYFGVADGAFLYTDHTEGYEDLPRDSSCEHMHFLLSRCEKPASDTYSEYVANNARFHTLPLRRMSPLTELLLRRIDYEEAKRKRTDNFRTLHDRLGRYNRLDLRVPEGAFAYPLWIEDGEALRKKAIAEKVYIPVLWPDVCEKTGRDTLEHQMAADILPLPCDQRYGAEEMKRICEVLGL
ncbi:MAG: hypothetical protein HUJ73_00345 [Eubacterium sp.]|nr:hypothetical protein [Eubacterium sp.]